MFSDGSSGDVLRIAACRSLVHVSLCSLSGMFAKRTGKARPRGGKIISPDLWIGRHWVPAEHLGGTEVVRPRGWRRPPGSGQDVPTEARVTRVSPRFSLPDHHKVSWPGGVGMGRKGRSRS